MKSRGESTQPWGEPVDEPWGEPVEDENKCCTVFRKMLEGVVSLDAEKALEFNGVIYLLCWRNLVLAQISHPGSVYYIPVLL